MSRLPAYSSAQVLKAVAYFMKMLEGGPGIQVNDAGSLRIPSLLVYDRAAAERIVKGVRQGRGQ